MKRKPFTRTALRTDRSTGLHRGSCTWIDAVGPGYAVGVSPTLVDHAIRAGQNGYCR